MSNQVFADGLGGILVMGTTVRLDFVVVSPADPETPNQAKLELQQRIILPVEGFLRAAAKIQEAAQALAKPVAVSADKPVAANVPVASARTEDRKAPFP